MQIKVLLEEMGFKVNYTLVCDAQAAIDSAQKLSGSRLRHLEIAQRYALALVRGKHARIKKISGKLNVADCLTKHLNSEDTKAHIERLNWRPLDMHYNMVELLRINGIKDIINSDKLVIENEAAKRKQEVEEALRIAKKELNYNEAESLDGCPVASRNE